MAENLRRLASNEALRSLPDKLNAWLRDYHANTCDQNLNICLELIEQVAKLQGQLFGILTVTAQEGGHYGGIEIIKSRLLPWLEASFTAASMGKPIDSTIPSLQDTFDKDRHSGFRDQDLLLESELNATRSQLKQVQDDLAETEKTLEETKNRSAISLLAAEEEINQLKKQLKSLQSQEEARHRNSDYYPDYRGRARGKSLDLRNSEPRSAEPRYSEPRSAGPHYLEPRSTEPRHSEPRSIEPRYSEPRGPEPKYSEPRGPEPRYSEPRYSEPRGPEPRYSEPRYSEPRYSEPRYSELRGPEPKYSEPRGPEPRYSEPRGPEPRYSESRSPEPRYSQPQVPEPRYSEPRGQEIRYSEPWAQEPRYAEPRGAEPRYSEPRYSEAQGMEPRHPEPRGAEAQYLEPQGTEPRSSESRGAETHFLETRTESRSSEVRTVELKNSDRRSMDQRNPEALSDYEKELRTLKDEIAVLSAEKNALQGRSTRSRSPSPAPRSRSRSASRSASHPASRAASRSASPSTAVVKIRSPSPTRSKLSSMARKAALVSRFSDAYSQARLDAQCLLRRCVDKAEMVQRIIYIATVEAFHVAKMAFRHFKIRVRKTLTPNYAGSNFEDVVLDYIICHLDLYDAQSSVNDVIRAMNVNPKISFPPEVDFCILSDFIQEICCIAFAMQTLEPPLDIAFGADGEIFNDSKYRRSYDSDFTAPLVFYHVWPALMENDCVILKGEAVTKRGAFVRWPCIVTIHPKCFFHKFENIYKPGDSIEEVCKELLVKIPYKGEDWNSVRPLTRCRSRSLSPICPRSRIGLSTLSRSRSPSPIRCGLPGF